MNAIGRMKVQRIIVGVDFSLTSPAVCLIFRDDTGKDHFRWVSIYYDENPDKLLQKESGAFYTLSRSQHVKSVVLEKDRSFKKTYSEGERAKTVHALLEASSLKSEIEEMILKNVDTSFVAISTMEPPEPAVPVFVAMEGISFGSKGNTLIDICIATGMVRWCLFNITGVREFYAISPTTVKAFAIHGSSDKSHLMHALMAHEDLDVQDSELVALMHKNRDLWVTPGGTVKKPIEDLSDSTWVALALRAILDGEEIESVRRPKKSKRSGKVKGASGKSGGVSSS